jgi:mono/diheme cytochrome c family protein
MRKFVRNTLSLVLIGCITLVALQIVAAQSTTVPTFYKDIHPIFVENCITCHTPGGIGPFDLNSAEVAHQGAPDIAKQVQARTMPPWMPGENNPPMLDERKLSDEEVQTILDWVEAGAPLGDPADATSVTSVQQATLRADLTLEMPTAYTPDDTLQDDYRCFIIESNLPANRFITGYNVLPEQSALVHHVLLFQVNQGLLTAAQRKDAADDRPGWQCFGGTGLGEGGLADAIGSWVPGSLPTLYPEGMGRLMRSDAFLVVQMHYNLDNLEPGKDPSPDQTSFAFQLAEEGAEMQPISLLPLFAPVEIPCPSGQTNERCNRETALANMIATDGPRAERRTNGLLGFCGKTPDDYVDQDAAQVTSSCLFPVTTPVLVIGSTGHMHLRGASFSLEHNPGKADAQMLLDIPAWDFHWQGGYQYVTPIRLERGDTLRITCTWDNSEGEHYILWGEGTTDEMCLGALYTVPG